MRIPFTAAALLTASVTLAADWQAGLAKVKITPEKPIRMAGYASRTQPSQSVSSDLWTKALALEDSDGNRALLITADTLGFPGEMAERITQRLGSAGIDRSQILLNASHTHAGPLVMARLGYGVDGVERERVVAYGQALEDKAVEAGREALANLKPARLGWGGGVVHFVMNRRESTDKGIMLGVNPRGPVDRSVPVLRISAPDGEMKAVIFGAACHCTTLTGKNMQIDGDYAGHAQSFVEEAHAGVQAMFLTGCAGDANPYPRGTLKLAKRHGKTLGAEVVRVLTEKLKPVAGPIRTEFRRVDLPLQKFSRDDIERMASGAPSYRKFFTDGALARLDRGEPLTETYNAPFAIGSSATTSRSWPTAARRWSTTSRSPNAP